MSDKTSAEPKASATSAATKNSASTKPVAVEESTQKKAPVKTDKKPAEKNQQVPKIQNNQNQPKRKEKDISTRAVMQRVITLGSHAAQRMFHRTFKYIARKAFNLTVYIPVMTADADKSNEFDGILEKYFDEAQTYMNDGIEQTKLLMASNGILDSTEYKGSMNEIVEVDNPFTMKYLNCMQLMDGYIRLVETCWISGLITSADRTEVIQKAKRKITALSSQIGSVEARAFDAIKSKNLVDVALEQGANTEHIDAPEDDEVDKKAA